MTNFFQRLNILRRRLCFIWLQGPRFRQFSVGASLKFNVPLRSGGSGALFIGRDNIFGYADAPCLGNGEVLIQPRRKEAEITIGNGNVFNNNVTLIANERIVIGDGCLIGDQVAIYDSDFHEINPTTRKQGAGPTRPVMVGNNVWLGSRVMVLKGVTIGDNSVIGAMSLVTKSIPANCLAAGNPAKVIRTFE